MPTTDRILPPFGGSLALSVAALCAAAAPTFADEAFARQRFGEMSAWLGGHEAVSFDYVASLDVVTDEGQILTVASSGTVAWSVPTGSPPRATAASRPSRSVSTEPR